MKSGKLVFDHDLRTLKAADYNPRQIDAVTFAKLRASVRALGCVKPIIARGNVIVAGHQRTRAMLEEGIFNAPVFLLGRDASTYDEVRFNQLHNGTDMDVAGERVTCGASLAHGWNIVPPAYFSTANPKSNGGKLRNDIMVMITRFGNWGGCVATSRGEVFHAAQYALCAKTLGVPCLVFVVPPGLEDEARRALGAKYGEYSYEHLPKHTFIQTLAQLPRLSGTKKLNCSPAYEKLVIPWMSAHPDARVLDFGCGRGDYVAMLARRGFNILGLEFFKRAPNANRIDVSAVNAMVDAVENSLRKHGLFDAVVCDYVLNSVDTVQAESDVVTCVSALCKKGGTVWMSGRSRECVERNLTSTVAIYKKNKRQIEFFDKDGFSGLFRKGRWFYQKFHTVQQARQLAKKHGIAIRAFQKTAVAWQIEGNPSHPHAASEVEEAIAREFNLPLNDAWRRLGRDASMLAAYREAIGK